MEFPNRIRYLRIRSRLSQKELAKLIDRSQAAVANHELGRTNMDSVDLAEYVKVFKCYPTEIFVRPKQPKKFR